MRLDPIAFMSYVNEDDRHEGGRLTRFLELLSGEVRMQTGEPFPIFQDRKDIAWGESWRRRIEESLDGATFLLPILTPGFFRSEACRGEAERFLERENRLGRADLILPVYYVECPAVSDPAEGERNPLAKILSERQYTDWRDLRFEPETSPAVRRRLADLARQIRDALARCRPAAQPESVPQSPRDLADAIAELAKPRIETELSDGSCDEPATTQTQDSRLARRNEPTTLVVDALRRGDHATITEAMDAAPPGSRIMVRPGLYRETVLIDKPVEIIGDGERSDIVVEGTELGTVRFRATMGRIANLTLRQPEAGKCYCVDIAQGRLDLEDCDITSRGRACVAIHGGADPRLRRNRIHDGQSIGVFIYDNGQGTLEENDIFGNGNSGVSIREGGNPVLRSNRIHGGKTGGILVSADGRGTMEDNDIFANEKSGVSIREGGDPTLRRNRIHAGRTVGIEIRRGGKGTIEENEIFGNEDAGVVISSGGNPVLRRNRIHDEKTFGVAIESEGLGLLEENESSNNRFASVTIRHHGNPTLRRNRIHDDRTAGIVIAEDGLGTLEENEIFQSGHANVTITKGGNPTLSRNRIHGGEKCGVSIFDDGLGTLEDNDIFDNKQSGISIMAGGKPTLTGNRIIGNARYGIEIDAEGGGAIRGNDLRGNGEGAWLLAPGCESRVERSGNEE